VDKSYCGSPLEVLVQFATPPDASQDLDPSFDLANVFVFARFESENEDALNGGPHSLRNLRTASQRDEEAEPLWIEGIQSLQAYGSQTSRNSKRFASATFTLNGEPFDKWYHHWESGANRSQRSTRHALKAYVFYLSLVSLRSAGHFGQSSCVQQEEKVDGALELLCVASSPLFVVTSYRRSSSSAPMAVVDTAPAQQLGDPNTADPRVHYFETDERRQLDNDESRAHPLHYPHLDTTQILPPDEQKEEAARRSSQRLSGPRQDRQARQRGEGLHLQRAICAFPAQPDPAPRTETRVFDRKRRRAGRYQCQGDPTSRNGDYRAAVCGDIELQRPALRHGIRSETLFDGVEPASRPVELPPSSPRPMRPMSKEANEFSSQLKAPQRPLESLQATVHQLADLAVIHFFASRVTAKSARRDFSDLPTVMALAIAEFWWYDRVEAVQLANVVFAVVGGIGDSSAMKFWGRSSKGSSSEEVLRALTRVCGWTSSPGNPEWMQGLLSACYQGIRSFSVGYPAGTDEDEEKELRSAFLTCIGHCWVRLDGFLKTRQATRSAIQSVGDLSDAMIGAVYSDPALAGLRHGLRGVLQRCTAFFDNSIVNMKSLHGRDMSLVVWRQFVASVHEGSRVRVCELGTISLARSHVFFYLKRCREANTCIRDSALRHPVQTHRQAVGQVNGCSSLAVWQSKHTRCTKRRPRIPMFLHCGLRATR
jgi:hypothetical protein